MKQYNYISIKEVLSRVLRHPMLRGVTLEECIQYVVDILSRCGFHALYEDKEDKVNIESFRGLLPCDLVRINQVKDLCSNVCLRAMTSTFTPSSDDSQLTYKTQGRVIYTSFKEGEVLVSYKAMPVDDEGFPLLQDDPILLGAIESYIKKEVFTVLFDMGKISPSVLQNSQQDYAWKIAQCQAHYNTPSVDEMQSLKNEWCTLLQRTEDHHTGFQYLGVREDYKTH